jgi:hypothetical protein
MNPFWSWLSEDDERDPREFREYVSLFKERLATPVATPELPSGKPTKSRRTMQEN